MKNYDHVLEVLNATCDFLSHYEGKKYEGSVIPIEIRYAHKKEKRNLVVVYERDKKELARAEITDRFEDNSITDLFTPSNNYIQLACLSDDKNIRSFLTFDEEMRFNKNVACATIVDDKYKVIGDMFKDWYITKDQLGNDLRDDDIYQHAFVYALMCRKKDAKSKAKIKRK